MSDTSTDKKSSTEPPAPEVLKAQSDDEAVEEPQTKGTDQKADKAKDKVRLRRGTYRPSHKATFIGLAVVVGVLALNAGVIYFILQGQNSSSSDINQNEVTLSTADLDKLGVSRNPVGNTGQELVVGPNARFSGNVIIGNDVSVAGQLTLNNKLSASDVSVTNLQAGDTSLNSLNVNGDGTVNTLNLRNELAVVGASRLQGPVTISQLLTVNNSVNIIGNLAVGGTISVRNFQASSLVSDTTLTIGGHIITRGSAPGLSAGGALGSNGTVSISGNDAAGTVAANIGVGASSGIVATVTFRKSYASTPRVVVTPIGAGINGVYVNRSANGFSIGVNSAMGPGGYAFDYIVMQ